MIIYVLSLEGGKYYVGRTNNLNQRLEEHQNGQGCGWTVMFPVLATMETFEGDKYDEEKTVLRYMDICGIENVRGGMYGQMELSFDDHCHLTRQLRMINDQCLVCGERGHFAAHCPVEICLRCGGSGHTPDRCEAERHAFGGSLNGCYRCGRPSHWAIRCNRTKNVFGQIIESTNPILNLLSSVVE